MTNATTATATTAATTAATATAATTPAAKRKSTQINVRIDAELKERGERGLREAGINPSEAVRMLYEFAAAHERMPGAIAKALAAKDETARRRREAERERRQQALEHGSHIVPEFLEKAGLKRLGRSIANMDDDELLAEALAERYGLEV